MKIGFVDGNLQNVLKSKAEKCNFANKRLETGLLVFKLILATRRTQITRSGADSRQKLIFHENYGGFYYTNEWAKTNVNLFRSRNWISMVEMILSRCNSTRGIE